MTLVTVLREKVEPLLTTGDDEARGFSCHNLTNAQVSFGEGQRMEVCNFGSPQDLNSFLWEIFQIPRELRSRPMDIVTLNVST